MWVWVLVSPGSAAQAMLVAGFAPRATSMLCSALPGLVSETEHELQRDFSRWPPALFALFLAGSRQASSHEMHKQAGCLPRRKRQWAGVERSRAEGDEKQEGGLVPRLLAFGLRESTLPSAQLMYCAKGCCCIGEPLTRFPAVEGWVKAVGIGYEPRSLANSRMLSKFLLGLEHKKVLSWLLCGSWVCGGAVLGS